MATSAAAAAAAPSLLAPAAAAGTNDSAPTRRRIAIVGAGLGGLAAAWLLAEQHDVVVFERESRVGGGSARTALIPQRAGGPGIPVDTAMVAYEPSASPNLVRLLSHFGVPTEPSASSGAFHSTGAGSAAKLVTMPGIFSLSNVLRPATYIIWRDLHRWHHELPRVLLRGYAGDRLEPLGSFLRSHGYSTAFSEQYLAPLLGTVRLWTAADWLAAPIELVARVLYASHLLFPELRELPHTVIGGTQVYVDRLHAAVRCPIHLETPVTAVARTDSGVALTLGDGNTQHFDVVLLAVHASTALELLLGATERERAVLSPVRYAAHSACLHTDPALLPPWAQGQRVAYTVAVPASPSAKPSFTAWMNAVQPHVRFFRNAPQVFLTVNPEAEHGPTNATIHHVSCFEVPVLDVAAVRALKDFDSIQGADRVYFSGSYVSSGSLEDSLRSALQVASSLGAPPPWALRDCVQPLPKQLIDIPPHRIHAAMRRLAAGFLGTVSVALTAGILYCWTHERWPAPLRVVWARVAPLLPFKLPARLTLPRLSLPKLRLPSPSAVFARVTGGKK